MSGFLDFISNFIEITGNSTADSIILTIIGLIAFLVAFGFVGMIFDALGIYDSDLMSDTHWIVRVIVFLGLSFICIEIAKFIKWLFSFQWWIYLIAGIVLIGIIILLFVSSQQCPVQSKIFFAWHCRSLSLYEAKKYLKTCRQYQFLLCHYKTDLVTVRKFLFVIEGSS